MTGRKVWVADEVLSAEDLDSYLMDQVVTIWPNASARSSNMLTPIEGQLSYLQDTNLFYRWDGSAWVDLNVVNAAKVGGITIFNSSTTPTANAVGDLWFY